jgi:putative endonuclease
MTASEVKETKDWAVYVLDDGKLSYVGTTNDCHRRFRQHKGEIKGGGKFTQSMNQSKLRLRAVVWPLSDQSTGQCFEAAIKRAHGLRSRVQRMYRLAEIHGWSMGMLAKNAADAAEVYGIPEPRFTDARRSNFSTCVTKLSKMPTASK